MRAECWLRAEIVGPSTMTAEDWAGECAAALASLGLLGIEETSRDGAPLALAWLPEDRERAQIEAALAAAGLAARVATLETIADPGWVEQFNATLQPIDVGRRLTIIPGEGEPPPGRVALRIEPGRAFGTGHHESTRLALEWIEELVPPARSVLDMGTGSGILAAAALELGAERAIAADIDPEAIEVAEENLRRMLGARADAARLVVAKSPEQVGGAHDLVLANIQADVILKMLPSLAARLAPGGALVLSGLLVTDRTAVEDALRR